jgi:hypothetical protein
VNRALDLMQGWKFDCRMRLDIIEVEVRTYLKRREEEAKALRARIESDRPSSIPREDLLARRRAGDEIDASTGQ